MSKIQNDDEPAFAWWVPYTIKKKACIISNVKSKYWSKTHKYGVLVPKSVNEAVEIDHQNGNALWWDAIMKEMKNVRPAFEIHEGTVDQLVGYPKINCHMIFDVKLGENFRRKKARLVAGGGHVTDVPSSMTYSLVVSRDLGRIALTIAALNGLDILACDIQNAYLSVPCREKIYCVAGPEFGSDMAGEDYGGEKGFIWFEAIKEQADPDVWMRGPATKPDGWYAQVAIQWRRLKE
eukprot:scaffold1352_cov144-Cylindrotheca_fusiformis.AAC.10